MPALWHRVNRPSFGALQEVVRVGLSVSGASYGGYRGWAWPAARWIHTFSTCSRTCPEQGLLRRLRRTN